MVGDRIQNPVQTREHRARLEARRSIIGMLVAEGGGAGERRASKMVGSTQVHYVMLVANGGWLLVAKGGWLLAAKGLAAVSQRRASYQVK